MSESQEKIIEAGGILPLLKAVTEDG
jgi:hypothetical protein